jgi:hypothetical protein
LGTLSAKSAATERWPTRGLPTDADSETILFYACEVERLKAMSEYQSIERRQRRSRHLYATMDKFLSNYTMPEDEVLRFFVRGVEDWLFTLCRRPRVERPMLRRRPDVGPLRA